MLTVQTTSTNNVVRQVDWRKRPWYIQANNARKAHWTKPYAFTDGRVGVTFAKPIFDKSKQVVKAVVAIDIVLNEISQELSKSQLQFEGIEFICDTNGTVLGSSLGPVFINCDGKVEFVNTPVVCVLK